MTCELYYIFISFAGSSISLPLPLRNNHFILGDLRKFIGKV